MPTTPPPRRSVPSMRTQRGRACATASNSPSTKRRNLSPGDKPMATDPHIPSGKPHTNGHPKPPLQLVPKSAEEAVRFMLRCFGEYLDDVRVAGYLETL